MAGDDFGDDARVLRDPAQIAAFWDAAGELEPQRFQHRASPGWWELLAELGITLLVTREYEHLVLALRAGAGGPEVSFLRAPHPSGIAVDADGGAVYLAATRNPNQLLALAAVESGELVPVKASFHPGGLYLHDLAIVGGRLYGSAVGRNAVVEFAPGAESRPVWWPRSLDELGEDRFKANYLQLNSIAGDRDIDSAYFSASAAAPGRRRPGHLDFKVDRQGVVFSAATREPVATGLTRPHSARLHRARVWVDNSGYGEVGYLAEGGFEAVARLPGWTRGLSFVGDIAFVGTSRVIPKFRAYAPGVREESCAIHALDLATGSLRASLSWPHGNQIFAIDWCPAGMTTGFPFHPGAPSRRLKRAQELFYDHRLKRSINWLA
ncbi:MAG: TIGR03032 family protein [Candidatus Dormibacteraeota bacterium]|nr:TIGR03032 family protein [Candidatus Dormibacteraeota bacterium]